MEHAELDKVQDVLINEIQTKDETINALRTELDHLRGEFADYKQHVSEVLNHVAQVATENSQPTVPPPIARQQQNYVTTEETRVSTAV